MVGGRQTVRRQRARAGPAPGAFSFRCSTRSGPVSHYEAITLDCGIVIVKVKVLNHAVNSEGIVFRKIDCARLTLLQDKVVSKYKSYQGEGDYSK